jgi:hypothetical protein
VSSGHVLGRAGEPADCRVVPAHVGIELGVGDTELIKVSSHPGVGSLENMLSKP